MKYEVVIETDDYEDFEFFEDGNGKYIHGIDAGAVNNEWIALYFKECKQESILDKIRAEITAIDISGQVDEHTMFIRTGEQVKQVALQIIDKYNVEGRTEE